MHGPNSWQHGERDYVNFLGLHDAPRGKWGADEAGNKTTIVEEGFAYPSVDTISALSMPSPALGPEDLQDYLTTGRVGGSSYEPPASRLQAHFLEVQFQTPMKAVLRKRGHKRVSRTSPSILRTQRYCGL